MSVSDEQIGGAREGGASDSRPAALVQTLRLVIQYDGTAFEGWQIQDGDRPARTVQGLLRDAAAQITGQPARIRGAGRTDAGVHAWGQIASLRVESKLTPARMLGALNARLPADVAVLDCQLVAADWDALRAARAKHYRYQIWNGRVRSPLRAARWHWVREGLDVGAMRAGAEFFVGRQDFAAMQASGSSVKTTVRNLTRCDLTGAGGGEIILDVEGEGFLRHMVRNLAGTLIEVGRGRWQPDTVREILNSLDRGQAGPTAPAHGLAMMRVWDDIEPRRASNSVASGDSPSDDTQVPDSVDDEGPVG